MCVRSEVEWSGSDSHISVLNATMARSPCRKIPKESMRAPFSQPRLSVPCVGLKDTDVLLVVVEPAGLSAAPPPPATSCSCGNMLTPLTASMGQKIAWKKRE